MNSIQQALSIFEAEAEANFVADGMNSIEARIAVKSRDVTMIEMDDLLRDSAHAAAAHQAPSPNRGGAGFQRLRSFRTTDHQER